MKNTIDFLLTLCYYCVNVHNHYVQLKLWWGRQNPLLGK
jgi:hypothetical protein